MRSLSTFVVYAVISVLLVGCGSSPPVRYFSLSADYAQEVDSRRDAPVMSLGPLRFPEYLERSQIVTRGRGNQMIVDDFNRWAEPLDQAIPRALAADVDRRLGNVVVIAFPNSSVSHVDYRVVGTINRFDVDQDRQALFSVQWSVNDSAGEVVIPARRSRFVKTAASASPGDLVEALSDTVAQFSHKIATELEASLPEMSPRR